MDLWSLGYVNLGFEDLGIFKVIVRLFMFESLKLQYFVDFLTVIASKLH